MDPKYCDKYCKMLDIQPLPAKGDYYVRLDKYAQGLKAAKKPAAGTDEKDAPVALETTGPGHEAALVEEGIPHPGRLAGRQRETPGTAGRGLEAPRRYDPLISSDGSVFMAILPGVDQYREASRALTARAMLLANAGKVGEAWQDLLACHRLARLTGQGPTLVEALVAIAVDATACAADQALLQHPGLTSEQIAKMQADLDRLPPMPKMVDKIDVAERFIYLDCVGTVARRGLSALGNLTGGSHPESVFKPLIDAAAGVTIDWDQVLRTGNSWFDRLVAACGKPTRAERRLARARSTPTFASFPRRPRTGNRWGWRL